MSYHTLDEIPETVIGDIQFNTPQLPMWGCGGSHYVPNIDFLVKKFGKYWIGPAGVHIPWQINRVPATSKSNYASYMYFGGDEYNVSETQLLTNQPAYTDEQYREKFAHLENGKWYWKT